MASIHGVEGSRVYVRTAYGEPAVAALKALGAHWDRERRMWWVGKAKRAALEEALVGSDRAQDEAAAKGEAPAKEDPADIRLVGKAKYKGRVYYVRWAGRTKRGTYAMRLVTLDAALDFWADGLDPADLLSDVRGAREREAQAERDGLAVLVKTYQARQVWDGRRYSGRTVERHTTLADIQRFIRDQADPATRRGECSECGCHGPAGETCTECHEGSYC
jgi:hypothetical protein